MGFVRVLTWRYQFAIKATIALLTYQNVPLWWQSTSSTTPVNTHAHANAGLWLRRRIETIKIILLHWHDLEKPFATCML